MRTALSLSVDPVATSRGKPRAERFWSKVDKSGDCWLWTASKNAKGYGTVREGLAHRVAWALARGPIPPRRLVLHSPTCVSRACVRPDHLRLGTQKENVADTMAAGRANCQRGPPAWIGRPEFYPRGEKNAAAKLTADLVVRIREEYAAGGVAAKALGARYGVGTSQTLRILRGESWSHVGGPLLTGRASP